MAATRTPREGAQDRARRRFVGVLRLLQDRDAEQGREHDRHDPGRDQRDGDHGEDREGVLPAELRAKPIGTNPATVTRVPVSIGKAVEV